MTQPACKLCGEPIPYKSRKAYCGSKCSWFVAWMRAPIMILTRERIVSGELKKLDGTVPCVDCGKPAEHYDHRKYLEPENVVPVCRGCNVRRGPAEDISSLLEAGFRQPKSTRLKEYFGCLLKRAGYKRGGE